MRNKELTGELKIIGLAFITAIAVMKAAYYKESILEVIKTNASIFWLFVIPGYAVTFAWRKQFGAIERITAGTVLAMAINSIASYYLGIAGLKIQNQTIILPIAVIAVSLAACLKPWARPWLKLNFQTGKFSCLRLKLLLLRKSLLRLRKLLKLFFQNLGLFV